MIAFTLAARRAGIPPATTQTAELAAVDARRAEHSLRVVEVQAQPYPGPGPRRQVSLAGGLSPAWSPAGREIFFLSVPDPDGKSHMMSVAVAFDPTALSLGTPRRLFTFSQPPLKLSCIPIRCYAVSPDGQLFYALQFVPATPQRPATQINLATNWVQEMKARVAAGQAKQP